MGRIPVSREAMNKDIADALGDITIAMKEGRRKIFPREIVELLIRPVIDKYSPQAGQGQKISKEIWSITKTYLANNGFQRLPDRYGSPDFHYIF